MYVCTSDHLSILLFDILVRFRQKWVALIGNTEKTFLNIEVYKADWHCLRFLWLEDVHKPDSQTYSQTGVYHFCHVIFALTASLFLLNVTLRYHTSSYKVVDPEFVKKMIQSFYVENNLVITSHSNKAKVQSNSAKDSSYKGVYTHTQKGMNYKLPNPYHFHSASSQWGV